MNSTSLLTVQLQDDGVLVISVGIETLVDMTELVLATSRSSSVETPYVADAAQFAKDIAAALLNEAEDGTTLVHRMFDAAASELIEQGGTESIGWVEDE